MGRDGETRAEAEAEAERREAHAAGHAARSPFEGGSGEEDKRGGWAHLGGAGPAWILGVCA